MLRPECRGGWALQRCESHLVIALVPQQPAHRAMTQAAITVVENDRSRGECGLEFLDGGHGPIMPRSQMLSLHLLGPVAALNSVRPVRHSPRPVDSFSITTPSTLIPALGSLVVARQRARERRAGFERT